MQSARCPLGCREMGSIDIAISDNNRHGDNEIPFSAQQRLIMDPNSEFLKEIDELLLDSDNEENSDRSKVVSGSSKESLPLSTSDSTTVNGVVTSCSSTSVSLSDTNRFSTLVHFTCACTL